MCKRQVRAEKGIYAVRPQHLTRLDTPEMLRDVRPTSRTMQMRLSKSCTCQSKPRPLDAMDFSRARKPRSSLGSSTVICRGDAELSAPRHVLPGLSETLIISCLLL